MAADTVRPVPLVGRSDDEDDDKFLDFSRELARAFVYFHTVSDAGITARGGGDEKEAEEPQPDPKTTAVSSFCLLLFVFLFLFLFFFYFSFGIILYLLCIITYFSVSRYCRLPVHKADFCILSSCSTYMDNNNCLCVCLYTILGGLCMCINCVITAMTMQFLFFFTVGSEEVTEMGRRSERSHSG